MLDLSRPSFINRWALSIILRSIWSIKINSMLNTPWCTGIALNEHWFLVLKVNDICSEWFFWWLQSIWVVGIVLINLIQSFPILDAGILVFFIFFALLYQFCFPALLISFDYFKEKITIFIVPQTVQTYRLKKLRAP